MTPLCRVSRQELRPDPSLIERAATRAPQRVLAVGAHPDDIDANAGGTLALWASTGAVITYCILTDGNAGGFDPSTPRDKIPEIRRSEQRAAAADVGARAVHFLGYQDGCLAATPALRRDLTRIIRLVGPDRVICHSPERLWYGRVQVDHPDHLAAGEATLCAVYPDARNPFAYENMNGEGLAPHQVTEVWVVNSPTTDVVVDVSSTIEKKVTAFQRHASQLRHGPEIARQQLLARARRVASKHGMKAETFGEEFKVVITAEHVSD